jgi:hypothetical protein
VQVLKARHVAPHDDEVHAPGVLDVEVAHGAPAAVDDAEGERERPARGRGGAREPEVQPAVAHGEPADALRAHRRAGAHRVHRGLGGRGPAPMDVDAAARERGCGEDEGQDGGEPGESGGRAHAGSAS